MSTKMAQCIVFCLGITAVTSMVAWEPAALPRSNSLIGSLEKKKYLKETVSNFLKFAEDTLRHKLGLDESHQKRSASCLVMSAYCAWLSSIAKNQSWAKKWFEDLCFNSKCGKNGK